VRACAQTCACAQACACFYQIAISCRDRAFVIVECVLIAHTASFLAIWNGRDITCILPEFYVLLLYYVPLSFVILVSVVLCCTTFLYCCTVLFRVVFRCSDITHSKTQPLLL